MSFKTWVLIVCGLMTLQIFVVMLVTRANKEIFNKHKATSYSLALQDLAKQKPMAAATIRWCYGLCVFEWIVVAIAKYV